MNIEIIDVTNQTKPTKSGNGSYQELTVTYKDEGGKIQGKKILSFNFKDVFERLSTAKKGDCFAITSKKNDAGYWDWTEIERQDAQVNRASPTSAGTVAPKSNYETPEERARKQVYIVRQSSITSAIALLGAGADVNEVLKVAEQFEHHVFGTKQAIRDMSMAGLESDDIE